MSVEPSGRTVSEPLLLAACLLINAAAAANYSALMVSIADIAHDLGVSSAQETWLPDSFLLAVVCITLLTARLLARLGELRTLRIAVWGLTAASAATAVAQGFGGLVGLMFVQGLFAAPLAPATHALISTRIPYARQGVGMAIWTAGTAGGFLAGSVLSGVVTQNFGWRWISLIGIPVGLAGLLLMRMALAPSRARSATRSARAFTGRSDPVGAILLLTSLLSAAIAMDLASEIDARYARPIALLSAIATLAAIAFAVHYRHGKDPILDLSTLRDRRLSVAATINFVITGTSTGIYVTVMLGSVANLGPDTLGNLAALRSVALLIGIALTPLVLGRSERYVHAAALGLVITCAGKYGYLLWGSQTTFEQAAWPGAVSSVGMGLLTTALAVMAVATIDKNRAAAASSLFVFSGVVGSALGIPVLGVLRALHETASTSAAGGSAELASFIYLFRLELLAALLLLPLPFLAGRGARAAETAIESEDEA